MVVILLNERSFTKAQSHILALKKLKIPILLVSDYPVVKSPDYTNILTTLDSYESVYKDIYEFNKKPRYITTVSEQLLPLVSQLEKKFDLRIQVPIESAKILADKFLFEQFMANNGLSENMPTNLVPTKLSDFDSTLIKGPILIKPTVGSGSNLYFKKETDLPHFEYIKWNSLQELKSYLIDNSLMDIVLSANNNGLGIERFSMYPTKFQIQPYYWSDQFSEDFYGVFISGAHKLFARSSVARMSIKTNRETSLIDGHRESKHDVYARERAVWHKPLCHDEIHKIHSKFITKVLSLLNINNLIYAGPSWFNTDIDQWIGYDFNPRVSGLLSHVSKECAPELLEHIWRAWLGLDFSWDKIKLEKYAFWGACLLKEGTVKKVHNITMPRNVRLDQKSFISNGTIIPKHISLQTKGFPMSIICTAKSSEELIENYFIANQRIQMAIEYL